MDAIYFNEQLARQPLRSGALDEYIFAVKDVFAVAGAKNSAGNPYWYATHASAEQNAQVIEQLLQHGAALHGLTHTDELMYSLNGENVHFGTPPNPLHVEHIPGGSSSGSAAAAKERHFTIGTDTGGSIRVPASYCGLYGIRPTHDAVSLDGVIPLAPSFDTVGWMSTSSTILKQVGDVLLDGKSEPFERIILDEQAWSFLEPNDLALLMSALGSLSTTKKQVTQPLTQWVSLFRMIQGIEIWQTHGEWVEQTTPLFAPAIAERFTWASTLDASQYDELKKQQQAVVTYMKRQLATTDVLVIPTTASVAPRKNASAEEVEEIRTKTMQLTCIAGLTGFPQVTVPIMRADGLALGLSFIAGRGCDRALLDFVDTHFGGAK